MLSPSEECMSTTVTTSEYKHESCECGLNVCPTESMSAKMNAYEHECEYEFDGESECEYEYPTSKFFRVFHKQIQCTL